MKKTLLLALLPCLLLTGCYDSREVDNMAYVMAVGVDSGREKELAFTLQFAVPLNISGGVETGDKSEGGGGPLDNLTIEADSLYHALDYANNYISKQVNVSHCKLIVFSEEVARKGLNKYENTLVKGKDFRPNTFVATSLGQAKDYLGQISSPLELNPARYYELIYDKSYSSFTPTIHLKDFYYNADLSDIETVMPLAHSDAEDKTAQINGMAVFKDNRMVGTATGDETVLFKMLNGTFKSAHVPIEADGDTLVFIINQKKAPQVKISFDKGVPQIGITLNLEGELVSGTEAYLKAPSASSEFLKQDLTERLQAFLKKTQTEYGADIVGFGKQAKRRFATIQDFDNYHWDEMYKAASVSVKVSFESTKPNPRERS